MQTLHQGSCEITLTIPVNYVPHPNKIHTRSFKILKHNTFFKCIVNIQSIFASKC